MGDLKLEGRRLKLEGGLKLERKLLLFYNRYDL